MLLHNHLARIFSIRNSDEFIFKRVVPFLITLIRLDFLVVSDHVLFKTIHESSQTTIKC